jgi:hypothetical protein
MFPSQSVAFKPIHDAWEPERPLSYDELMALLKKASPNKTLSKQSARRRVHPETSVLIGAKPGRGSRAKRPVAAGRIRKIINKLLRAFATTAGAAGRARTHANSVLQRSAQTVRASFRRASADAPAAAGNATPRVTVGNPYLATENGMKIAFVQSIQDALKNSAATAEFKGVLPEELDDCLGSQTRRPLRSLVTGMKMALGTVLRDDTHISARGDSPVPKFDPVRAALSGPAMRARFDALLLQFPEVENVYARLTPWGNGENKQDKLDALVDLAKAAGSTPPVYFLVYQAPVLKSDIQYARGFLETLVADMGMA